MGRLHGPKTRIWIHILRQGVAGISKAFQEKAMPHGAKNRRSASRGCVTAPWIKENAGGLSLLWGNRRFSRAGLSTALIPEPLPGATNASAHDCRTALPALPVTVPCRPLNPMPRQHLRRQNVAKRRSTQCAAALQGARMDTFSRQRALAMHRDLCDRGVLY